jgi:hypothetical protein
LKPFSLGSATPPVLWGSWTGRVSSEACTLRGIKKSTLEKTIQEFMGSGHPGL